MARSALSRHWIAHWFGCGLSPVAPGTVGSLGAIPFHLVLCTLPFGAHCLAILVVTAIGLVAAERASRAAQVEDPSAVVIDEVAGTLIALAFVAQSGLLVKGAAFGLFRLLDITKPGWIDRVQRLRPNGLGIMADDVLAGALAGALAWGLSAAGLG